MIAAHRWFLVGMIVAAACESPAGASEPAPDARVIDAARLDGPALDGAVRPRFQTCRDRAYTPAPTQGWRHSIQTPIVLAAGAANHSAQDLVDDPARAVALHGKFAYGLVSKDLEDEIVRVSIDDCTGWIPLGDFITDSDGRIAVPIAASVLPAPGVYEAIFQVLGDRTMTRALVWRLPAGTRIALSDIDGTLTASDAELFQQILDGSHVPVAYPAAVELTEAHAAKGHVILYLTGRPYYLTQRSRDWLDDLAFAPGPLHVTDSNGEALPTEAGVGDFKKAYITAILAAGYPIDVAYGNATTDVYAYLGAGIPADRIWIIGDNGGAQGTHAVAGGWTERVAEVEASPVVTQPFDW